MKKEKILSLHCLTQIYSHIFPGLFCTSWVRTLTGRSSWTSWPSWVSDIQRRARSSTRKTLRIQVVGGLRGWRCVTNYLFAFEYNLLKAKNANSFKFQKVRQCCQWSVVIRYTHILDVVGREAGGQCIEGLTGDNLVSMLLKPSYTTQESEKVSTGQNVISCF